MVPTYTFIAAYIEDGFKDPYNLVVVQHAPECLSTQINIFIWATIWANALEFWSNQFCRVHGITF